LETGVSAPGRPGDGHPSRIALVVITDGRFELLRRTLTSLEEYVVWPWTQRVLVNDSGDPAYAELLAARFPRFDQIAHQQRRGFAGAVRTAWAAVADADYLLHLEDDFRITRPVDLAELALVLDVHPHLVQMTLLRQAVSPTEKACGGIIQVSPEAYEQRADGRLRWIEHRRFFTTNPSLVPRWVTRRSFADPPDAEGKFGRALFAESPAYRSAFWGSGEVWVEHLGDARSAGWQA
jgi:hypothetical protein